MNWMYLLICVVFVSFYFGLNLFRNNLYVTNAIKIVETKEGLVVTAKDHFIISNVSKRIYLIDLDLMGTNCPDNFILTLEITKSKIKTNRLTGKLVCVPSILFHISNDNIADVSFLNVPDVNADINYLLKLLLINKVFTL